ncbi:MAG: hypothetical protein LBV30_07620, partial [Propionibacteriaceae bacterium]|nr:hypothetical protein [Propionibacteriaceae bacterium]
GAVVGIVAGLFFGWIGTYAVGRQVTREGIDISIQLAMNWPQTLGLIGILLVLTAAASILPGIRAAKASPVEALSEI